MEPRHHFSYEFSLSHIGSLFFHMVSHGLYMHRPYTCLFYIPSFFFFSTIFSILKHMHTWTHMASRPGACICFSIKIVISPLSLPFLSLYIFFPNQRHAHTKEFGKEKKSRAVTKWLRKIENLFALFFSLILS